MSKLPLIPLALAALVWWLTRPGGVPDRRLVLDRGLGSGLVLGGLWMAEIGFNNLAPPEVSTASSRGVVDNVTWAIVGVVTVAVVVLVTARTRRWRSGLRAGVWSGVGSGLGAGLGGALLLAFLRDFVVRDPLMQVQDQLSVYYLNSRINGGCRGPVAAPRLRRRRRKRCAHAGSCSC